MRLKKIDQIRIILLCCFFSIIGLSCNNRIRNFKKDIVLVNYLDSILEIPITNLTHQSIKTNTIKKYHDTIFSHKLISKIFNVDQKILAQHYYSKFKRTNNVSCLKDFLIVLNIDRVNKLKKTRISPIVIPVSDCFGGANSDSIYFRIFYGLSTNDRDYFDFIIDGKTIRATRDSEFSLGFGISRNQILNNKISGEGKKFGANNLNYSYNYTLNF